jgi:hypothetical protein
MNRDTAYDPIMVDIVDVQKHAELVDTARHARPMYWQRAFYVRVEFEGKLIIPINLLTFIMNPAWKAHDIVKYLENWVLVPANQAYKGSVLHPKLMPIARQTSPSRSPTPTRCSKLPDCTVRIEEVDDDSVEEETFDKDEFDEITASLKRHREEESEGWCRTLARRQQ